MLNLDVKSHRPLREIVYEELRDQILVGNILPGTRLMEVELAEEMEVSRTPIREAIRKLEKEGLITIEPRRGAYVSEVSVKDMLDILEVRSNLEGLAAYLAAYRMTKEEQNILQNVSDRFDAAVQAGSMKEMIEADTKFHHLIVESSRNQYLIQMVEQLQELVLRFRYLYYKDFKRAEEMPPEHHGIFDAIRQSRPDKARESAFSHIDKLRDMVLRDDLK